jgi:6-phosphogluconolactonase
MDACAERAREEMTAVLVTGDRSHIERSLVTNFQSAASDAMAAHGAFRIALSGGSIGPLFFPALARLPLDWSLVDFFWADERAVPPTHPDSNFAEADRLWLTPAGVPSERIHRMHAEGPDLPAAARAYAAELRQVTGTPPALDFALLGVGPDGHVASLFPGHPALEEEAEAAVSIEDAPKPPPRRITLTLPVLAAATRLVVAAEGEAKAAVIRQALEPGSSLPAGMLISRARNVSVLLVK